MMMPTPPIDSFKALAHPLRYRILAALAGQERNVGEIEAATGIGQPALSQQLAILRNVDLVTARRDAKMVYYTITAHEISQVLMAVAQLLPENAAPEGTVQPHQGTSSHSGAAVFAQITV